jgi:Trypsin-co-occurring domain 1
LGELVEFQLEDGSSVLIEVERPSRSTVTRGGRVKDFVERADDTFEQALGRVGPTSAAIVERFRAMTERPDEIEVEFGVKLSAEAGAIIARTSGEANFRITARWRRG